MSEEKFTGGVWGFEYGLVVIGGINYEFDNAHDAPLIAAAPEMYEYLSHMVEHDVINDQSIEREVKSLLAKARGEDG